MLTAVRSANQTSASLTRRFLRMRSSAITIQRVWRGYAQKRAYQHMRVGYMRLQALIRSRVLSHRFKHLRGHVVGLQVSARDSDL